jgi:hypothetical protein
VEAAIEFNGKRATPVLLLKACATVAKNVEDENSVWRKFRTTYPIHEILAIANIRDPARY